MSMSAGPSPGERACDARQQPHRPQVDVLVEPLPDRQDQLPHRHVVGHARIADRTEVDRVELLQLIEAVGVHHPAVAPVEVAAPRELRHLEHARRGPLDDVERRRHDFLSDPVAGNDGDFMHRENLTRDSALGGRALTGGFYQLSHSRGASPVGQLESWRGSRIPAAGRPPKEMMLPSGSST